MTVQNLGAEERETTVTSTDADDTIRIWTTQRKFLGRLRKHEAFTEVGTGFHGTTEWAEFTIPADQWNPATGAKRKRAPMTEEQRAAAQEHLARARESRGEA